MINERLPETSQLSWLSDNFNLAVDGCLIFSILIFIVRYFAMAKYFILLLLKLLVSMIICYRDKYMFAAVFIYYTNILCRTRPFFATSLSAVFGANVVGMGLN